MKDLTEDDWAMSEPEVPIDREPKPEPIDQVAAKLYEPPDTGDLSEWDITTKELETDENQAAAPLIPEPPAFDGPVPFSPPKIPFEILKPIITQNQDRQDWGMNRAAEDGWKMPDPVFRASGGTLHARGNHSPRVELLNSEPVPEILSDIYSPPETEESLDTQFENELRETESIAKDEPDFANVSTSVAESFEKPSNVVAEKPKSKNWSVLLWIFLIGLLIFALLAFAVFAVFYYTSWRY